MYRLLFLASIKRTARQLQTQGGTIAAPSKPVRPIHSSLSTDAGARDATCRPGRLTLAQRQHQARAAWLEIAPVAIAERKLHTSSPREGWFTPKPPSFAAAPLWKQEKASDVESGSAPPAPTRAPRRPLVVRKNFKLVSNPLYRFANMGALERQQPGEAQPLPGKVAEALAKYTALGLADGASERPAKPQPTRLGSRQALLRYSKLKR